MNEILVSSFNMRIAIGTMGPTLVKAFKKIPYILTQNTARMAISYSYNMISFPTIVLPITCTYTKSNFHANVICAIFYALTLI